MMMGSISLELAQDALAKVEVTDFDGQTFEVNFSKYINGAKLASRNCNNVAVSAENIDTAYKSLEVATEILVAALDESLLD